jgi:hypothetical protein
VFAVVESNNIHSYQLLLGDTTFPKRIHCEIVSPVIDDSKMFLFEAKLQFDAQRNRFQFDAVGQILGFGRDQANNG